MLVSLVYTNMDGQLLHEFIRLNNHIKVENGDDAAVLFQSQNLLEKVKTLIALFEGIHPNQDTDDKFGGAMESYAQLEEVSSFKQLRKSWMAEESHLSLAIYYYNPVQKEHTIYKVEP